MVHRRAAEETLTTYYFNAKARRHGGSAEKIKRKTAPAGVEGAEEARIFWKCFLVGQFVACTFYGQQEARVTGIGFDLLA